MSKRTKIGVGIGVAAAAVLAGLFLYGKDGKKRLKKLRGWMLKAKGEVIDRVEKLKEVNEEAYYRVVDEVLRRYTNAREVGEGELLSLSSDLKKYWKDVKKDLKKDFEITEKKTVKKAKKGIQKIVSAGKK